MLLACLMCGLSRQRYHAGHKVASADNCDRAPKVVLTGQLGAGHGETPLLVAERDGPEMLARIAVMKALNRHAPPVPRQKSARALRIVR